MTVNPSEKFWGGRRVLITGHSGFKGSWLTLWLNQMGAEIMGFSVDDRESHELFYTAKIDQSCKSIFGDLRRPREWSQEVLEFDPEIVFHLAAQSLVRKSYDEPAATFDVNVMGTVNLLETLKNQRELRSIVVATTDKVYRDVHLRIPFKEDDHLGGHDPYSASKAACEIVVASYRQSYFGSRQIALSTGRAGNVIGGGDWALDRLIPDAIRAWRTGDELLIRNPMYTRPWQHVLEPLLGYLVLAEKTAELPTIAGSYNFGPRDSEQSSVGTIVELASQRFLGSRYSFGSQADNPHESEWLDLDARLAKEILSVEPRLTLEESVNWTIDWYKNSMEGKSSIDLCTEQVTSFLGRG
jgi:CDP-glucose 4,6-dehydratase